MNHSKTTLGELLSSQNETIKRNAFSILKQLVKEEDDKRTQKQKECTHYRRHAFYLELLRESPINPTFEH